MGNSKKNIADRTLDRSRACGQIVGAQSGTDARWEQDGLYFAGDGRICNKDRMLPAEGEKIEFYAQVGQTSAPEAAPITPETMIPVMVEGRQVMKSVAEIAAEAGITGTDEDDEPDQAFSIASPEMDGAIAIAELDWPELRRAAAGLKVPGKNKDGILEGFKSLNITHVKRT